MKKQLALIAVVLGAAVVMRAARLELTGIHSDVLPAWPSQVIFGIYFAILALAIQAIQRLHETGKDFRRQSLLLLMLIGVCADLVLINVQEINERIDASYGLVVIWDVATFFTWLRVIDSCQPRNDLKFRASLAVAVAPLLGVGREILFLPYKPEVAGLAYFDLLFGHFLTSLWVFIPLVHHSRASKHDHRTEGIVERTLVILVFTGCAYWLVSALENTLGLAWAPFEESLRGVLRHFGIPIPLLNCFQFVIAVWITLTVWYWDFLGLGSRFGVSRKSR